MKSLKGQALMIGLSELQYIHCECDVDFGFRLIDFGVTTVTYDE